MSQIDRRKLRLQLNAEFPGFELHDWYVQYRELKTSSPDAILLYRLGDFYETFDDDAKLVAEKLGVTLTHRPFATPKGSKNKKQDQQRCAMAGIPYHAVERYVGQLVAAGYRVAIAEQISETPSSKSDTRPRSVYATGIEQSAARKEMVDREIVRVITPGTIIDSGLLPAAQNNYLAALIADRGRVGLAYADLSTGEFACTEFSGESATTQAQGELARLQAVEVLVPDDAALRLPGLEPASARLEHDLEFMTKGERELLLPGERVARRIEGENTARWAHGHVTSLPAWRWELPTARDTLLHQLGVHRWPASASPISRWPRERLGRSSSTSWRLRRAPPTRSAHSRPTLSAAICFSTRRRAATWSCWRAAAARPRGRWSGCSTRPARRWGRGCCGAGSRNP